MNFCKDCVFNVYGKCGKSEVNRRPDNSICDNDYACEYFREAAVNYELNSTNVIETLHRTVENLRIQSLGVPTFHFDGERVDVTIPAHVENPYITPPYIELDYIDGSFY